MCERPVQVIQQKVRQWIRWLCYWQLVRRTLRWQALQWTVDRGNTTSVECVRIYCVQDESRQRTTGGRQWDLACPSWKTNVLSAASVHGLTLAPADWSARHIPCFITHWLYTWTCSQFTVILQQTRYKKRITRWEYPNVTRRISSYLFTYLRL